MSPRQQQVLRLISQFMTRHGLPPTRADLARALRLRNRQGIDQHLRAIERKGYLRLEPGIARGIRLLSSAAETTAHTLLLPLYGRVAAGVPTLAQSNIEETIVIDRALFRPGADFLLRVHGQSMRDAGIADRDILAVHRTPQASNGQIVVARLGDEATVKYYRRRGSLLRLEPANPEFAPLELDLRREACEIEGIVVGIVRTELPRRS
ncbi:MAG TPA: transcriptional repressor LexA [Steroidobacteraceae bacterium]|nr:transcriptional repressor LexA [Steroidobacteraceae bacterium]